ncbi:MAG: hypothetical protein WCJ71_03590 [Candidatus Omnitrophota bacterium]
MKAAVLERRTDSFPGLFDACVRKTHQDQLGESIRDIDFDIDGKGVDAHGKSAFDAYHEIHLLFRFSRPAGTRNKLAF